MRFLVKIYREGDDYSAMVPDLPGCVAAGETVEGVRILIAKAIFLHLELMMQTGERVIEPTDRLEFVVDEENGEEFCTWVDVQLPQVA